MRKKDILNTCIIVLVSITMIFMITACSRSSSGGFEDDFGTEAESDAETNSADHSGVTDAGYEYTAYVDQEAYSCSVEYLGTQIDIDSAELEYTPEYLEENSF